MPLSVLIATGTTAAASADTVLADGAQATLVLTGEGRAPVEVKISNGQYVRVAELTTTNAVQKIYGPAVFRVRRDLVLPTWVPNGQPEVTVPFGVEVYTDAPAVAAVTGPATNAELRAAPLPVTDSLNGTRAYTWSAGTREAFTTASTAALALPALGSRREVRIVASARCFVRFGESGLAAATVAAGQAIFPSDCPEVIVIPVGVTHYRVIGETVGGSIAISPVA